MFVELDLFLSLSYIYVKNNKLNMSHLILKTNSQFEARIDGIFHSYM